MPARAESKGRVTVLRSRRGGLGIRALPELWSALCCHAQISVMRDCMSARVRANETASSPRRGGSREAIVDAAERLFLQRGFGAVSMDDLAEAADVARRTLYNQFTSKEEIFREMLVRLSGQLEHAIPPGIETRGDVEDVLRLIARAILDLHARPEYLGFLRMVAADSAVPVDRRGLCLVMDPQTERLERYLAD